MQQLLYDHSHNELITTSYHNSQIIFCSIFRDNSSTASSELTAFMLTSTVNKLRCRQCISSELFKLFIWILFISDFLSYLYSTSLLYKHDMILLHVQTINCTYPSSVAYTSCDELFEFLDFEFTLALYVKSPVYLQSTLGAYAY